MKSGKQTACRVGIPNRVLILKGGKDETENR